MFNDMFANEFSSELYSTFGSGRCEKYNRSYQIFMTIHVWQKLTFIFR